MGIEEILLAYGPLGVMTLVAGWAIVFLWRELKKKEEKICSIQKTVMDTILEARRRETELLREMAQSEVDDKEQYMKLCYEMQRALEALGEKLDYVTGRHGK